MLPAQSLLAPVPNPKDSVVQALRIQRSLSTAAECRVSLMLLSDHVAAPRVSRLSERTS
jgi:hypothetical protein